ncbi:MAG TPA: transposase [bacterium]|nr:transposase [bacterium]
MARQKRIALENTYYHIINRGVNNEKIFLDSEDRIYFLNLIKKGFDKNLAELITYSLMVTHYHLCAFFNLANISKALHYIEFRYAQYFNKKYNRNGHLFQNRFTSIIIQEGDYFQKVIDYIHLNPVKSGMSKDLLDYKWCGLQEIFGIDNKVKIFTNHLKDIIYQNREDYLKHLIELAKFELDIEVEYKYFTNNNGFYGEQQFINEKLENAERRKLSKDQSEKNIFIPKRWSDRIKIAKTNNPEEIYQYIKKYYDLDNQDNLKNIRVIGGISFNSIAIYILHKIYNVSFNKIVEIIKTINKRSISNTLIKISKKVENDIKLKKEIDNVIVYLQKEVKR